MVCIQTQIKNQTVYIITMIDNIVILFGSHSFFQDTICSKIYKPSNNKDAFFLYNMGIGDMIVTTRIIEFLTTIYDTVTVICKNKHINYLYDFHHVSEKHDENPIELF